MRQDRVNGRRRNWFRSLHRWLGSIAAFFVLLLAVTGIALNHGHALQLDRKHVRWDWLLAAYGMRAPAPSVSHAAGGHRATLLGGQLYLDDRRIAQGVDDLTGVAVTGTIVVLAGTRATWLLTPDGELIERMDLAGTLPGPIQRAGVRNGLPVLQSQGQVFESDAEVTAFHGPAPQGDAGVDWSDNTPVPAELAAALQADYRGQALSWERLLADVHSGRIAGRLGPYLMDLAAISLIALSMTGLLQWRRRRNGNGRG